MKVFEELSKVTSSIIFEHTKNIQYNQFVRHFDNLNEKEKIKLKNFIEKYESDLNETELKIVTKDLDKNSDLKTIKHAIKGIIRKLDTDYDILELVMFKIEKDLLPFLEEKLMSINIETDKHKYNANLRMLIYIKNILKSYKTKDNELIRMYEYGKDEETGIEYEILAETTGNEYDEVTGEFIKIPKLVKNNKKNMIKQLNQFMYLYNRSIEKDIKSKEYIRMTQYNGITKPYNYIKYNSIHNAKTNNDYSYNKKNQKYFIELFNSWSVNKNQPTNSRFTDYNEKTEELIIDELSEDIIKNKLSLVIYFLEKYIISDEDMETLDYDVKKTNKSKDEIISSFYNKIIKKNYIPMVKEVNVSYLFGDIEELQKGYKYVYEKNGKKQTDFQFSIYKWIRKENQQKINEKMTDIMLDLLSLKNKEINFNKSVELLFNRSKQDRVSNINILKYKSIDVYDIKYQYIRSFIFHEYCTYKKVFNFKSFKYNEYVNDSNYELFYNYLSSNSYKTILYKDIGGNKNDPSDNTGRIYNDITKMPSVFRTVIFKDFNDYDIKGGMFSFLLFTARRKNIYTPQLELLFKNIDEIREKLTIEVNIKNSKITKSDIKMDFNAMVQTLQYKYISGKTIKLDNNKLFNTNSLLREVEKIKKKLKIYTKDYKIKGQNAIFYLYSIWENMQRKIFVEKNNIPLHRYFQVHDAIYTNFKVTWTGDDETVIWKETLWKDKFEELLDMAQFHSDKYQPLKEVHQEMITPYVKAKSVYKRCTLEDSMNKWSDIMKLSYTSVKEFYSNWSYYKPNDFKSSYNLYKQYNSC